MRRVACNKAAGERHCVAGAEIETAVCPGAERRQQGKYDT